MSRYPLCSVLLLLFLNSCQEESSRTVAAQKFDLALNLVDFKIHAGFNITIGVYSRNQAIMLEQLTQKPDANGRIEVLFGKVLTPGDDYYLVYFADLNDDGACDPPPNDHAWILKVDGVLTDVSLSDAHRMSFANPCEFFSKKSTEARTQLTVSGKLLIDSSISGITGANAGEAIAGATVFVAGHPEQEARSGADGSFTLQLEITATQLATESLDLLSWYTVPKADKKPNDWSGALARLGARTPLEFVDHKVSTKNIVLGWTTALHVAVTNQNAEPMDMCWVRINDLSFQLVSEARGAGIYDLDYLPAGNYMVSANCGGLIGSSFVSLGSATGKDAWQTVKVIVGS